MNTKKLIKFIEKYYEWYSSPDSTRYNKFKVNPDGTKYIFLTEKKWTDTKCQVCSKKCRKSPTVLFYWNFTKKSWMYSCDYCCVRSKYYKKLKD